MRKVAFALFTVLAVLLAIEGSCRLTERRPRTRYSELTGYELVPGYRTRRDRVNDLGLRGRDATAEKRTGAFRVLAMGGSTTWGHKVGDDETWPACLEERLHAAGRAGVEVLNGGVPGWGLEQIALALERRRIDELRPDLVLVYEGWNYPLRDNAETERYARMAASSPKKALLQRFALVRWMQRRVERARRGGEDDMVELLDAAGWRPEIVDLKRREVPKLAERFAALSRERRVPLALIAYPALVQLPRPGASEPDRRARFDAIMTHSIAGVPEPAALHDALSEEHRAVLGVLRESAQRAGIPVLDVASRMAAALAKPGEPLPADTWIGYFNDRLHLTPEGNRAIAAALYALLQENGLLR